MSCRAASCSAWLIQSMDLSVHFLLFLGNTCLFSVLFCWSPNTTALSCWGLLAGTHGITALQPVAHLSGLCLCLDYQPTGF
jgi:hypothetical protein